MPMAFSACAFREIMTPVIEQVFADIERLMATAEGRQQIARDIERAADRDEQRTLHPRYPLPLAVIADSLKDIARRRAHAHALRHR